MSACEREKERDREGGREVGKVQLISRAKKIISIKLPL